MKLFLALMVVAQLTTPVNLWSLEHQELLHQIAAMRQYYGLAPLPEAADLSRIASDHSWTMARSQSVTHSDLSLIPQPWDNLGENVARASRIWLAVRAMMDSPGHRELILDPRWTSMGIGHIRAADGNVYVTITFKR